MSQTLADNPLDELPADVSQTETLAYEKLCESDEPLSTQEIAAHTYVTDSGTSKALRRLCDRGLVMSGYSIHDARVRVYWPESRGSR